MSRITTEDLPSLVNEVLIEAKVEWSLDKNGFNIDPNATSLIRRCLDENRSLSVEDVAGLGFQDVQVVHKFQGTIEEPAKHLTQWAQWMEKEFLKLKQDESKQLEALAKKFMEECEAFKFSLPRLLRRLQVKVINLLVNAAVVPNLQVSDMNIPLTEISINYTVKGSLLLPSLNVVAIVNFLKSLPEISVEFDSKYSHSSAATK